MNDSEALWLEDRRTAVTASDVAAVLGEDPHRTALHVYADKIGAPGQEETDAMRRGKLYEAAIIADYAHQNGRDAFPFERRLVRHKKYPWLGATFDATTYRENGEVVPLQVKWAVGSGWTWKEEPPKHYQLQVLVETAVFGSTHGALCGLVGPGPLHCTDIPFDDELFELIVPRLAEFMERVRDRRPPEPQSGLALEPLKRLWPRGDGQTITLPKNRLLGHEYYWADPAPGKCGIACCDRLHVDHYDWPSTLANEWESKKSESKRLEEESRAAEARLRHMLGGAQYGDLGDGSLLERKIGKRSDTLQRIWPKRRR